MNLRIAADGRDSPALARRWSALAVSLGVGYQQDSAVLTLSGTGGVELPRAGAALRFVADGADLGEFSAREVSGGSRDGRIVIECASVDPVAAARRPRDRQWADQTLGDIVRTVAADNGLTAAVNPEIGALRISARPQAATSDLAFLQRLAEGRRGRVVLQEDRLIVTSADQPVASLPALRVDVEARGAWIEWRRSWSRTQQRVTAAYLLDDGATVETVEAGSGDTRHRLPGVYPSRGEALAAARSRLTAGDVSRDYVEVSTALTPTAQILQPLELVGGDPIPVGFPPLVIHSIQHDLGRAAARTVLTARPAVA